MPPEQKPRVTIDRTWKPPEGTDPARFFKKKEPEITHEMTGRGILFFSFKFWLPPTLKDRLPYLLLLEHYDYVKDACWLFCGRLKVILWPPRRDSYPESRKDARHDIPIIVKQLYARLLTA